MRSENQGYLSPHTHFLRLPAVLGVAALLSSHQDAVALTPIPAPLGPGLPWYLTIPW